MPRSALAQLNVRSEFARSRAHELAKLTGMSVTQVVEDALRGYVPPGVAQPAGGLVRRGPILVKPAGDARVSQEAAEAALQEVRERPLED
jgi:hypothetical protein